MTRRTIPHAAAAALLAVPLFAAEIAYDSTNKGLRIGDGSTMGGRLLAEQSKTVYYRNDSASTFTASLDQTDYLYSTGLPIVLGDAFVCNSAAPMVLVSRNIVDGDTSGPNYHCFSDSSQLTLSNDKAYNSFDARVDIRGTGLANHYAAFQIGVQKFGSGTLTNLFGFYLDYVASGGACTNIYGLFVNQPALSGGATIGRVVGLLFNGIPDNYSGAGNPNYVILSNGGARTLLGGQLTAPKIYASSVGEGVAADLVHAVSPSGTEAFLRVQQQGNNLAKIGFDASSIDLSIYVLNTKRLEIQNAGHVLPGGDNTQNLGKADKRFATIFAGTGTIDTSDEREKTDIGDIPDAWLDAWEGVRYQRYKMVQPPVVAEIDPRTGEQLPPPPPKEGRWHIGLIAQQVHAAFAAHGIDAFSIGLCCRDDIGDRDRWGLRYSQVAAIEAAFMRRLMERNAHGN